MNGTVYIVCIAGVLLSASITFINCLIIRKVMRKGKKVNQEITLFFFRFLLDIGMGLLMAVYMSLAVLYLIFPVQLEVIRMNIGLLGLPSANAGAARAFLAMCISIERNIATYAPMFYYRSRRDSLLRYVFLASIAFGLFLNVVFFGFCDQTSFVISPNCLAFVCAIDKCARQYWSNSKTIVGSISFVCSVMLCCKLFYWKFCKTNNPMKNMSRVNALALIDFFVLLTFDSLPTFFVYVLPSDRTSIFESGGPHSAVCKLLGSFVDAILAHEVMFRVKGFASEDNSSRRQSQVNKKSVVAVM